MAKKEEVKKTTTTKKENQEIKKDVVKEIKEKVLQDLNKEIQSTIKESTLKFKEDVKEEIGIDIQNEVTNMMKQEEKRLLRGKGFSIFKRDVVILVLFGLLCYFGYCLYDVKYFDFMKSECERNGTCYVENGSGDGNGENKPQEIVKDKDWYIENYGYLLEEVQLHLPADQVSAYYLYSNDYKLSEIKSSYLLNMAYKELDAKQIKTNSQTITIEGSDLKNAFERLFGSTTYYKTGAFTYNCLNFTYNQEKDRYTAENIKCIKNKNTILEEIDNMYEEGDVLYIQTTATLYNESEGSYYTFDNLFDAVVVDVTRDDVSKNSKKLNKYQYQFKKANDTYYFDGITKLK